MTYFIGVDLHKTQFTVCVRGQKKTEMIQYQTTKDGYDAILKKIRRWKKAGHEVKIGVESTGNTRYFKNRVESEGARVSVINTLKFKVINESTKKTDKHDAATIAEFLEKDMLPESKLCSKETENIRRLLKSRERLVRSIVGQKNEVHALLVSLGMEDKRRSLQSKKGRQAVLDVLKSQSDNELEAQSVELMFGMIDLMSENVKKVEKQLSQILTEDKMVNHLLTFRGCGPITAWTIRAYTDDIKRFKSGKKYAAFCGLVPWVQNSNETIHHGRITKRGPQELRTAFVQFVMGINRCKDTKEWRLVERYDYIKTRRGSGKSIVATARKLAEIVWTVLSRDEDFDSSKMLEKYSSSSLVEQALSSVQ